MDAVTLLAALSAGLAAAGTFRTDPWSRLRVEAAERGGPGRAGAQRWWRWRRERSDASAIARDVSRVCLLLAVCLDAGRPPRSALRVVVDVLRGPARDPLASVLRQIDLGLDEAVAWASLGRAPGYRAMARDLSRAVHSGVALADLLRRHAADARSAALVAAQVRARAVGVTGVLPLVLCFLPAFVLLGIVPIFGGLIGRLNG